jgi:very-short-patch-repair endonuclease
MSDKGYKRPTKRSRDLRENMTEAEMKLWAHLSARKVAGTRFNTQFPIGLFICDFVSRGAKLVIEVDGATHGESERADAARTRFIERRGYRVIRFWNNEVMGNVEGVVAEIERVLREMAAIRNRPSPSPSRKREGNGGDAI